jgi:hypothetical protein
LSFLANLVEKKPGDKDMNIKYVPFTGRANYDSREGTGVGIVNCDPGDGVYVHVHEIAHGLEEDIPGALAASLEFLDHRCGSEPFQKLKDVFPVAKFEEYETGRKDNFDKAMGPTKAWYIGKDYQGRNTEVISVGMDTLYTDPVNFAKKDPEYFAFILGILDGSTRSI